jgi:DNA replication protein DnaC
MEDVYAVENPEIFTDAVLARIKRHYHGVEYEKSGEGLDILVAGVEESKVEDLQVDLEFFQQNPRVPLESLCAHFWNYRPRNSSQRELVRYARTLMEIEDPSCAAGLFIQGDTGVGKSHIGLAVTKELIKLGQEARYIVADRTTSSGPVEDVVRYCGNNIKLGPNQVWVIDDLNSPYGLGMITFKRIVLNAHNNGGGVFVTSNISYDKLMESGFVTDEGDQARYMDRAEGMFKILQVTGESNRARVAWHAKLDDPELLGLRRQLDEAVTREDFETAAELRDAIREFEGKKD